MLFKVAVIYVSFVRCVKSLCDAGCDVDEDAVFGTQPVSTVNPYASELGVFPMCSLSLFHFFTRDIS